MYGYDQIPPHHEYAMLYAWLLGYALQALVVYSVHAGQSVFGGMLIRYSQLAWTGIVLLDSG